MTAPPNEPAAPKGRGAVQGAQSPATLRPRRAWDRLEKSRKVILFLSGIWLVALVTVSLAAAALTLYAAQFQARTATLVVGGRAFSVWRAADLVDYWSNDRLADRTAVTAVRSNLAALQADADAQATKRRRCIAKASAARDAAESAKDSLIARLRVLDGSLADEFALKDGDNLGAAVRARAGLTADDRIGALLGAYDEARARAALWDESARAIGRDVDRLRAGARKEAEQIEAVVTKAAPLASASPSGGVDASRALPGIDSVLYELDALRDTLWGRLIKFIVLLPSDFLVLMLVSAMGLLGSSLQMIYLYFTEFERRAPNFYWVRPCFGIITAFVVYVVAKAGVPLIADPARLGGDAPVNPWFVAFLAIISGLLSERAIATLLAVGATYFRGTEAAEPPRWARNDLRPIFASAQRDPLALGAVVKADAQEWDDWLQGRAAVPAAVQTTIAAVLQRPKRDLFTDIPLTAPAVASLPDRLGAYYRADRVAKARVEKWLQDKGIQEPVALFLRSPERAADRASLSHDLGIPT